MQGDLNNESVDKDYQKKLVSDYLIKKKKLQPVDYMNNEKTSINKLVRLKNSKVSKKELKKLQSTNDEEVKYAGAAGLDQLLKHLNLGDKNIRISKKRKNQKKQRLPNTQSQYILGNTQSNVCNKNSTTIGPIEKILKNYISTKIEDNNTVDNQYEDYLKVKHKVLVDKLKSTMIENPDCDTIYELGELIDIKTFNIDQDVQYKFWKTHDIDPSDYQKIAPEDMLSRGKIETIKDMEDKRMKISMKKSNRVDKIFYPDSVKWGQLEDTNQNYETLKNDIIYKNLDTIGIIENEQQSGIRDSKNGENVSKSCMSKTPNMKLNSFNLNIYDYHNNNSLTRNTEPLEYFPDDKSEQESHTKKSVSIANSTISNNQQMDKRQNQNKTTTSNQIDLKKSKFNENQLYGKQKNVFAEHSSKRNSVTKGSGKSPKDKSKFEEFKGKKILDDNVSRDEDDISYEFYDGESKRASGLSMHHAHETAINKIKSDMVMANLINIEEEQTPNSPILMIDNHITSNSAIEFPPKILSPNQIQLIKRIDQSDTFFNNCNNNSEDGLKEVKKILEVVKDSIHLKPIIDSNDPKSERHKLSMNMSANTFRKTVDYLDANIQVGEQKIYSEIVEEFDEPEEFEEPDLDPLNNNLPPVPGSSGMGPRHQSTISSSRNEDSVKRSQLGQLNNSYFQKESSRSSAKNRDGTPGESSRQLTLAGGMTRQGTMAGVISQSNFRLSSIPNNMNLHNKSHDSFKFVPLEQQTMVKSIHTELENVLEKFTRINKNSPFRKTNSILDNARGKLPAQKKRQIYSEITGNKVGRLPNTNNNKGNSSGLCRKGSNNSVEYLDDEKEIVLEAEENESGSKSKKHGLGDLTAVRTGQAGIYNNKKHKPNLIQIPSNLKQVCASNPYYAKWFEMFNKGENQDNIKQGDSQIHNNLSNAAPQLYDQNESNIYYSIHDKNSIQDHTEFAENSNKFTSNLYNNIKLSQGLPKFRRINISNNFSETAKTIPYHDSTQSVMKTNPNENSINRDFLTAGSTDDNNISKKKKY